MISDTCTESSECVGKESDFCNLVYKEGSRLSGYCIHCDEVDKVPSTNDDEYQKHCMKNHILWLASCVWIEYMLINSLQSSPLK